MKLLEDFVKLLSYLAQNLCGSSGFLNIFNMIISLTLKMIRPVKKYQSVEE